MELYLLGYVGGYVISFSAPFQLYRSWDLQSTRDLSWRWVCTYLTGTILLFAYTCHEDVRPVWIPMTLEVSCTFLLLVLKFWLEVVKHKQYATDAATQTELIGLELGVADSEEPTDEWRYTDYPTNHAKEVICKSSSSSSLELKLLPPGTLCSPV
jgi:hypothetical protein